MSQCLQNLLDGHQKTGMEATHVSLTKRRKSPAPDVQLIQPQRQQQTRHKTMNQSRKEHMSPCPRKGKGLLSRSIYSVRPDQVPSANPQQKCRRKIFAAFASSPLVLPEVTPSSWQRYPSDNTTLADLHCYFTSSQCASQYITWINYSSLTQEPL